MALEFADRVNMLFRVFLQPPNAAGERREWSDSMVARVAGELTDGEPVLTRQYLGLLRRGTRDKPGLDVAQAIARAFAQLSTESGSPCTAAAILTYLAPTDTAGEEADPSELADVDRVRAHLTASGGDHQDDVIGVLARLGELNDPAVFGAINELLDQIQAKDAVPARRRFVRRLGLRRHEEFDDD